MTHLMWSILLSFRMMAWCPRRWDTTGRKGIYGILAGRQAFCLRGTKDVMIGAYNRRHKYQVPVFWTMMMSSFRILDIGPLYYIVSTILVPVEPFIKCLFFHARYMIWSTEEDLEERTIREAVRVQKDAYAESLVTVRSVSQLSGRVRAAQDMEEGLPSKGRKPIIPVPRRPCMNHGIVTTAVCNTSEV